MQHVWNNLEIHTKFECENLRAVRCAGFFLDKGSKYTEFDITIGHHYQSILTKGMSFTANSGTKAAVLLKGRSSTANSGTQAAVLLGMDRCGSFPLLSAPHSLFSI